MDCDDEKLIIGSMAELADALDLGSSSFGSAGSTPVRATLYSQP